MTLKFILCKQHYSFLVILQTHPSVYLNNVPEVPPKGERLKQDLANLLLEANEWDTLHDIIFQVKLVCVKR